MQISTEQNTTESICVILNPKAGNGQAGEQQPLIESLLQQHFQTWQLFRTQYPKHATILAHENGPKFDIVAVVGGDGSCHEVCNGLMKLPLEQRPVFTVLPFGTGGDFRKSLNIPKKLSVAMGIAANGENKVIDVGLAKITLDKGPEDRYFLNVAGFGANGEVAEKSNKWSKKLGGKVTFLNATIHTTFTYHPPKVHLSWKQISDDENTQREWSGEMLSCFIANATYCGGGMQVAPKNALGDGLLHLRLLPKMPVANQLFHLPKLYNDTIHQVPNTLSEVLTELKAAPAKGAIVQIDLDGELSGRLPAHFSLCKNALTVRGVWKKND